MFVLSLGFVLLSATLICGSPVGNAPIPLDTEIKTDDQVSPIDPDPKHWVGDAWHKVKDFGKNTACVVGHFKFCVPGNLTENGTFVDDNLSSTENEASADGVPFEEEPVIITQNKPVDAALPINRNLNQEIPVISTSDEALTTPVNRVINYQISTSNTPVVQDPIVQNVNNPIDAVLPVNRIIDESNQQLPPINPLDETLPINENSPVTGNLAVNINLPVTERSLKYHNLSLHEETFSLNEEPDNFASRLFNLMNFHSDNDQPARK